MKRKWKLFFPPLHFLSHSWFVYFFIISFILGWWMVAFHPTTPPITNLPTTSLSSSLSLNNAQLLDELSPIQRATLHHALAGQFSLMLSFIDQWDQDAKFLIQKGVKGIQRISSEKFLQAQILGHLLEKSCSEHLHFMNCKMNLEWMQDDDGNYLRIDDDFQRFLPQTFVAASFLLAIAPPQEIIALPKGMRYLPQIYSSKLDSFPSHFDIMTSEKLHLTLPNIAFVAPYSHPPVLEFLRDHKIQLYKFKPIESLDDIQDALLKVGHVTNHILEAQLLAIFMEASFISLDNRLKALEKTYTTPTPYKKLLFLCFHQHYMQPTMKSLTGQLLARILKHCPHLSCTIPESRTEWSIPYQQEKILLTQPDYLFISIPNIAYSQPILENQKALHQLEAFKSHRILYMDEVFQESPTQYIVLGYFDLYQALQATYCL